MISRKCLPFLFFIGLLGVSGVAEAANWTAVANEDPGVILVNPFGGHPKLSVAPDGALHAYPLSTPFQDSLDLERYAMAARFGTSGALATTSASTTGWPLGEATLLSNGSTVLVSETVVGRYAADGSTLWVVPKPAGAGRLIEMDGQNLLMVGVVARRLTAWRFATANGVLVESAVLSSVGDYCGEIRLAASETATWFAGGDCVPAGTIKFLSSPLRPDATWQPEPQTASGSYGVLVDADAGGVLVSVWEDSKKSLRKLSVDSGSSIWRFPAAGDGLSVSDVFRGPAGALMVAGWVDNVTMVHRVDPVTGLSLWSQSSPGLVTTSEWQGSDLVLAGTQVDAATDDRTGFVQSVDPASGTVQWQQTLTAARGGGFTTADVAIQSGQAVVIGADCPPQAPEDELVCAASLWRGDLAGGQVISMDEVRVRSGNAYAGLASVDSGQPILATLEMGAVGPQVRTKRVQPTDGATVREFVVPVEMTLPWWLPELVRVIPSNDGNYAVLLTRQYRGPLTYASDAVVYKINGSTGAMMWRRSLIDFSAGLQHVGVQQLVADSAGNIFTSAMRGFPNGECREERLKMSSMSGATLWQTQAPAPFSYLMNAPPIMMLGDDLLTSSSVVSYWRRLSGLDGSVVWSMPPSSGYPILFGPDQLFWHFSASGSALSVGRIDPATGASLWTGTFFHPDDSQFDQVVMISDASANLYVGARRKTGSIYKAVLVKFSGSTGSVAWSNRLDATTLPGATVNPRIVDGDWLHVSGKSFAEFGNYLTTVSSLDGTLVNSQVLYQYRHEELHQQRATGGMIGVAADGGLLLRASVREPGQPVRNLLEKRAAPSSAIVGAVRVGFSTSDAPATGTAGRSFVMDVTNDGTTTAPNLRTVLNRSSDVFVESLTCTLSGSPCAATLIGNTIEITTNLAPGATLRLAGRAFVTAGSTTTITLSGSAFSPYGFAEMDLSNNIAAAVSLRDGIFRSGMESLQ